MALGSTQLQIEVSTMNILVG